MGAEPASLGQLNAIIASFRFLDDPAPSGPAEASNPPYVQSGLELFRNEGDAYEVLVPEAWDLAVEPVYGEPRGVSRFVGYVSGFEGQSSSLPSPLVISVGSPDGSLYLCQSRACRQVVVRNPADLESKIEETWPLDGAAFDEQISETTYSTLLGGETARVRYPTISLTGTVGLSTSLPCSASAFHDSRPIVLTFECAQFRRGSQPSSGR